MARIELQKKGFIAWIRGKFSDTSVQIQDLPDLCDGYVLGRVTEKLTGKSIPKLHVPPVTLFLQIENINMFLDVLEGYGIAVRSRLSLGAEDISSGNETLTLGLIWALIYNFDIRSVEHSTHSDAKDVHRDLLQWCQARCDVKLCDFRSFDDGHALLSILNHCCDDMDQHTIKQESPSKSWEFIFQNFEKRFGISSPVTAADIVQAGGWDDLVLLLYLSAIRKAVESLPPVASVPNPCAACKAELTGAVVTAVSSRFHAGCFRCSGPCGSVLELGHFREHDGRPYCDSDYADLFAPRCVACKTPVSGSTTSALGGVWHPSCFVCAQCACPLDVFFQKGDRLVCNGCHRAGTVPTEQPTDAPPPLSTTSTPALCAKCSQPVSGGVNALDTVYHSECFVCTACGRSLVGEMFFTHESKPYCENDYNTLHGRNCDRCKLTLKSHEQSTSALGRHWHPQCFKCVGCSAVLGSSFFVRDDQPCCRVCNQ